MRNISFMLTTQQVRDHEKDVTRRIGWRNLKTGERVQGIVKGQGLKNGERVEKLDVIETVDVRFEPLRRMTDDLDYGAEECRREGFPNMHPAEFVKFFCRSHKGCTPETEVTRIEFKYVD